MCFFLAMFLILSVTYKLLVVIYEMIVVLRRLLRAFCYYYGIFARNITLF